MSRLTWRDTWRIRIGVIKRGSVMAPRRPPTFEITPLPRIGAVNRSMTLLAELEKQLVRMLRGSSAPALSPPAAIGRPPEARRDSNPKAEEYHGQIRATFHRRHGGRSP
jgi:hypothetical protein